MTATTPLGVKPEQLVPLLGAHTAPFTWVGTSGQTDVELDIDAGGLSAFMVERHPTAGDLAGCTNSIELVAPATFSTTDGYFAEAWELVLIHSESPDAPGLAQLRATVTVLPDSVAGLFQPQAPAGSCVQDVTVFITIGDGLFQGQVTHNVLTPCDHANPTASVSDAWDGTWSM